MAEWGQGSVAGGIRASRDGANLILELENVEGLKGSVFGDRVQRQALLQAISTVEAETEAIFLVLGQLAPFGAADMPAFSPEADRDIRALCQALDRSTRPVVAVLRGRVTGPAADVALAAHARIMESDARFSFPAVELGLLPGAATAQRMARLAGADHTLRILGQSRAVSATEALATGLVDHVLDQDPQTSLLQRALELIRQQVVRCQATPRREVGLRDSAGYLAAVATMRQTAELSASRALVETVEAALLLPAPQAEDLDALLYAETAATDEAAALTHMRNAELRAAQLPAGLADFKVDPIRTPGLCGAEVGLGGLVMTALARGRRVVVYDQDRARLVAFLESIASRQEAAVQQGRLTPEQRDSDWSRLSATQDIAALEPCDLILASSQTLPPARRGRPVLIVGRGALADGAFRLTLTGRIGELALPASAIGQMARQAYSFLTGMGVTVLLTGQQTPMGVAGRLSSIGGAALRRLIELGVTPAAIVEVLTEFGLSAPTLKPVEGVQERQMPKDEILMRWLSALANEGARLLAAGVVASPLDIDLVAVNGLGFPRLKGGPLYQADRRGSIILRRDLMTWQSEGEVWKPVPALDALVSIGRGFAGAVRTE